MHTFLPLSLALLVSLAILVIGFFYMAAPTKVFGSFGLKLPATDADTLAWLHLKGIRDFASGLAVLALLATTDHRTVGILILVLAFIPFGDMTNVLISGGRKATAFSVHGVTCIVMILTGLLLLHVI